MTLELQDNDILTFGVQNNDTLRVQNNYILMSGGDKAIEL